MPQVKRVPSTLSHIAVDLDLNDSAHLATNRHLYKRVQLFCTSDPVILHAISSQSSPNSLHPTSFAIRR